MGRRSFKGSEKALGGDHLYTLTSWSGLALMLRYQGKQKEAEKMNRQAFEGCEKALGKDHLLALHTVTNLAVVLLYLEEVQGGGRDEPASVREI